MLHTLPILTIPRVVAWSSSWAAWLLLYTHAHPSKRGQLNSSDHLIPLTSLVSPNALPEPVLSVRSPNGTYILHFEQVPSVTFRRAPGTEWQALLQWRPVLAVCYISYSRMWSVLCSSVCAREVNAGANLDKVQQSKRMHCQGKKNTQKEIFHHFPDKLAIYTFIELIKSSVVA